MILKERLSIASNSLSIAAGSVKSLKVWIRRDDIDPGRLVDYALKIDVGAVFRRLGFLLELFEMEAYRELERLRERLTMTYSILDPVLPNEGKFLARWRLKLNVSPEEIEAVVRT